MKTPKATRGWMAWSPQYGFQSMTLMRRASLAKDDAMNWLSFDTWKQAQANGVRVLRVVVTPEKGKEGK